VPGILVYIVLRLVLWIIGVGVAAFPAISRIQISTDDTWQVSLQAINSGGYGRELIYVVVIISTLSLSAIIDTIYRHFDKCGPIIKLAILLGLIIFVMAIISALIIFMLSEPGKPLPPPIFTLCIRMLVIIPALGLITEICVSVRNL
jgi:hypothetical protein